MALVTNVLIRFLVNDDPEQSQQVYSLFKASEINKDIMFVPILVVLEMIWVLQSVYEVTDTEILSSLAALLHMPVLCFEKHDAIEQVINGASISSVGIPDLLIGYTALACQCSHVLTFDKKAAKLAFFKLLANFGKTLTASE